MHACGKMILPPHGKEFFRDKQHRNSVKTAHAKLLSVASGHGCVKGVSLFILPTPFGA